MEIYRKNDLVATEEQASAMLDEIVDFYENPVTGRPLPRFDPQLMKIWNGGDLLDWEWSEETRGEYDQRIKKEAAEAEELERLQSDNEYFKDMKLRPWRNAKLTEWIDQTFIQPLRFALTAGQVTERAELREELLDWTDLEAFDSYKTDDEWRT